MINFRTSSLFHYTSFNSLKRILQEGIKPNYCKEDFSFNEKEHIIGIPMVSFCDIPLMRAYVFTSRYGNHAIGLSKKWALKNNINPILYICNNDIISSLLFYKSYEHSLRQRLEEQGSNGQTLKVDLNNPDSISEIATLVNHGNSQSANLNLFGYAKKYESVNSKKVEQCNYEENEWRYIVKEDISSGINWKWNKNDYDLWRGDAKNKPSPTSALEQKKLVFEVDDITHIIVEYERQITDMINYVEKLKQLGGSNKILTDNEKKRIDAKIISMEQIENDF